MAAAIFCLLLSVIAVLKCNGACIETVPPSYDTIVIGLGPSGTTAATTLARAGKRVLALEAQGRIGGRVNTVPFGDGIVEVGAEWIHGQHPSRVYDSAIQNNVSVLPQDVNLEVFRSDGSLGDSKLTNELIEYGIGVAEKEPPEKPEPLGDFITKKITKYIKERHELLLQDQDFITELLELINLMVGGYEASNDWNDVSTFTRYKDLEGNIYTSWHRHGYKTFFEILLNKYNDGPGLPTLDIKLNTEVTQIDSSLQDGSKVVVTTKNGDVYTADHVIVTVSLGVLKDRYTTLFKPPLPEDKVNAINKMSIGVVDKVILSFTQPWWPKNMSSGVFIWRGEDKKAVPKEDSWVTKISGYSTPMGSSNTLTLWTIGDAAKLVETLPEDVVKTKCMELLRKFMGANTTVPEPTGMIRSTWYSNPFTRGSYTYDNHEIAADPTLRDKLARPLLDAAGEPRVLFAGEATDTTHFSTVHGASDSGFREATRLLNIITN